MALVRTVLKSGLSVLLAFSLSPFALVPAAYANEVPAQDQVVSVEASEVAAQDAGEAVVEAPAQEAPAVQETPAAQEPAPAVAEDPAPTDDAAQAAADPVAVADVAKPAEEAAVADKADDAIEAVETVEAIEEDDDALEALTVPARTIADGEYYIGSALDSEQVLDIAGGSTSNGGNVQLYQSNLTPAQRYKATYDSKTGYYTLKNVQSGKVLDVASGDAFAGANVQQWQSNGTPAQRWIITVRADGSYAIASALDSSLALAAAGGSSANGTNIQLAKASDSTAQGFVFTSTIMPRTVADGTYYISSMLNCERVLDIAGGSTSMGANVQTFQSNGTAAQRFAVTYDSSTGFYTIINEKSGMALDIPSADVYAGANVQQWQPNGTPAQGWIITQRSDGGYTLRAALEPTKVMDIENASTAYGANVQLWWTNGTPAQGFNFIPASTASVLASSADITEGYYTITSALDSSYVLDIAGGSTASGAAVQLYSSNGTWAQTFQVKKVSGYYMLISAKSGRALECNYASPIPGTAILQYAANSSADEQLWAIDPCGSGYKITNKATGLVISVNGGKAKLGAAILAKEDASYKQQTFSFVPVGNLINPGVYSMRSVLDSSMVVDVAAGSRSKDANVQLYTSNGTFAQKWQVEVVDDVKQIYRFCSVNSGYYLAVDGTNVCQRAKDCGSAEWQLIVINGDCQFKNIASNKVLTIGGGSAQNGANMQLTSNTSSKTQRFILQSEQLITDGYYYIGSNSSVSNVITVANASTANGANVALASREGDGSQKWYVERNSDGTYTITNALSGKVLDVANGNAKAGNNVQQYQSNDTAAQHWKATVSKGVVKLVSAKNSSVYLGAASTDAGANVELSSSSFGFYLEPTSWNPKPQYEIDLDNVAYSMTSNTDWLLLVDTETCYTAIYYGSQYNWEPVKYYLCGPGAPWSQTVKGHYTVTGRGYCFHGTEDNGDPYTCYYWTQFYGDYLFHSIVYWRNTFDPMDDTLGAQISHGCVRLELENAKWIYDNIPNGSHVYIW